MRQREGVLKNGRERRQSSSEEERWRREKRLKEPEEK